MLKWVVTLVVVVFVLGILGPHLARFIRFGHLPGDVNLRWRGRVYAFPLATTLISCLLFWLISRIV